MTVEADLYTMLKSLVGNRVYPDFAEQGTATPYIVFQEVSGEAVQFLERAVPSRKNGRFQIVVWSPLRSEAAAIGLAIEAAMLTTTVFQVDLIGGRTAVSDEETGLRGSRQDFGIWSVR